MVDGNAIDSQAFLQEAGYHLNSGEVDGAGGRRSGVARNRGIACYVISVD